MGAGIEGRGEARRCKRGERNEGWSVGRISCLVSFTVARCVMTVEWIIISLSFRLPPPPRHSRRPFALVLRPSFEPFLRAAFVYPVRNLASAFSTFSPFPLQPSSLQRHAKRNGQRVDGWVVGRGREGPSKGQRRYEEEGLGWEGRSRQNVPRNVPFSVPLFLLPTVVTNTLEFPCPRTTGG